MVWRPNVTVAAVVEREGRFLLVEEDVDGKRMLNQPAGHWEEGESLLQAVTRETAEETAWDFTPEALLGIYRWRHPTKETTFLRFAFTGRLLAHNPHRTLDQGIVRTLWLTPEELRKDSDRHRSPQVLRCVEDYLAGARYPLDCIKDMNAAG